MSSYGLEIKGKPPYVGVGMLVKVIEIDGETGSYTFPKLEGWQAERYGYTVVPIYSSYLYSKSSLQFWDFKSNRKAIFWHFTETGVKWKTYPNAIWNQSELNVEALLVYRIEKKFSIQFNRKSRRNNG